MPAMRYHYLTLEQRESLERQIRSRVTGEQPLKDALERLHDPKFGICIECHQDIAFVRLEEDPAALHCRACARLPVCAPSH